MPSCELERRSTGAAKVLIVGPVSIDLPDNLFLVSSTTGMVEEHLDRGGPTRDICWLFPVGFVWRLPMRVGGRNLITGKPPRPGMQISSLYPSLSAGVFSLERLALHMIFP